MAEEKVNTLLYEEAPEEVLLEDAWEARNIHFQLDQNTHLCEAGLMPEQQVRFRTDPGGSVNNQFREYGVNPIHEVHISQQEADAPLPQQSTPALSMTAQLDGVVVNRMSEYSGIQQMVRQAIQNASHEAEPEKSFLAKAGVKMVLLEGRAKCFMPTLSMNKVAVNYDNIMQGSMTMQQLHQELLKLAKQIIELPDAYSYRRFTNALKPDIRDQVLKKDFIPEFSNWGDQLEEDDQQYHFNNDEYEMRSIDNEDVCVNAVIKNSGYNDCHRLYGIRVQEAETDLRVSAVVQTGGKEQPVYDHRARRKAQPLPTRGKENETISVFWDISGTKTHCLLDSGYEGIKISREFVRANKLPKFELEKPIILQLACVGSKSIVQYGLNAKILLSNEKYDEYFDMANVDYYDIILGTPFLHQFEILLDFKNNCVKLGKLSFPNRFGNITPTKADKNENHLLKEKPKVLPASISK
ncbi:hypothetical protein M422DRAFT_264019 [Sphaerobolus stellatus SS14]|uniref:Uncharacterized protein n=1 Tax=Sphaerobolus stellatus (strain SS14) TaxID=990650 RepID=A0A0C9UGK7_SPHS4|nr:hypothetical protein M422DRAFT_264019 [Sphaerobolus stellatus SS14]